MIEWVSSDLHLTDEKLLSFRDLSGNLIRGSDFKNGIEEHDEKIIQNHVDLMRPEDKWICLGDIGTIRDEEYFSKMLNRIRVPKRNRTLVIGNHDSWSNLKFLKNHFGEIRFWIKRDKVIFSHIPMVLEITPYDPNRCIHGHIHQVILPDSRYKNVSVDVTNYCPVKVNEIVENFYRQ